MSNISNGYVNPKTLAWFKEETNNFVKHYNYVESSEIMWIRYTDYYQECIMIIYSKSLNQLNKAKCKRLYKLLKNGADILIHDGNVQDIQLFVSKLREKLGVKDE